MVKSSVDRVWLTGEDGVLLYLAAHIFFICVKIDPPVDQNQDIFFLALNFKFHDFLCWAISLYIAPPLETISTYAGR